MQTRLFIAATLALLVVGWVMIRPVSLDASAARAGEGAVLFPYAAPDASGELRWGYMDGDGRAMISPQFDFADLFNSGRGVVEMRGQAGVVDAEGAYVVRPYFVLSDADDTALRPFWDGLAAARKGGAWGFINPAGSFAIPPKFEGDEGFATVGDFSEGLAWFRQASAVGGADRYGFIDATGEVMIEPRPGPVNDFGEGLAGYTRQGRWGFMDRDGREVIKPSWDGVGVFADGLAPALREGRWGYIDRRGKWAIQPAWRAVNVFSDGVAAVQTETGWGFIDASGALVLPAVYDEATWFANGLARVAKDGERFYIDREGMRVGPGW